MRRRSGGTGAKKRPWRPPARGARPPGRPPPPRGRGRTPPAGAGPPAWAAHPRHGGDHACAAYGGFRTYNPRFMKIMRFLRHWWLRISLLFTIIGPGIVAGTADNDAGGITTYSVVGAHFGYQMLWVLPLAGAVLWLTQDMGARLGLTTGKGLAALIRENFSIRLTLFVIVVTMAVNWLVLVAGFAGIASIADLYGVAPRAGAPGAAPALSFIIVKGNFQLLQRVFLTSSLLFIAYIIAGLRADPDWSAVAGGLLLPKISRD